MKWQKIQWTLLKISFVMCLCFAVSSFFYYLLISPDDGNRDLGSYYAYHVNNSSVQKAIVIWGDSKCSLVSSYGRLVYDSIAPTDNDFYMDTTSISIELQVKLIDIMCDSTVGLILFPNKYFHPEYRVSNINPTHKKGLIDLNDLHNLPVEK